MILIFLLLMALFPPQPILASGEFNVTQNITYSVSSAGLATVSQEINLTNNISQIYAKEYQVNLFESNIENFKGHDKYGDIVDSLKKSENSTIAYLKFQNPVIGKNQTNQFYLNYTISEFAKKKGNTWEIQFPVFDNLFDNQQINVSLDIPTSFGELSFSSIPIVNTHTINNRTQIQFNQNQIKGKILLIFGDHQLFDFKLHFFLQNEKTTEVISEIPVPPDTNSQTITFQNITPLPNKIRVDADGNWLAQYSLPPKSDQEIIVTGQAKIHPPVLNETTVDQPNLTKPQKFWPVDDPKISNIAQNLRTPKQIYQYVVKTLNYNYNGIDSASRQGALASLDNPNLALCTEFTDLFISIARSNKIPAREIEGYAFSNNSKIKPTNINSDILHAWPEYFDANKKIWVQVDPTWEKTTNGIDYFSDLDLNHLAFVIHGQDSTNPHPPGSYKKNNLSKSVFVDFATENIARVFTPPVLSVEKDQLTITNPNLYSISPFSIKLNNTNWVQKINSIPPFSSEIVTLPKIPFLKSILPQFKKYSFVIESPNSNSPIQTNLIFKQHYLNLSLSIGIIIFILCLSGIILTASKKTNEKNS